MILDSCHHQGRLPDVIFVFRFIFIGGFQAQDRRHSTQNLRVLNVPVVLPVVLASKSISIG